MNDTKEPNFKIVCPKCNRNNCVIDVKGEPINIHLESGTETGVKLHVQYTCNDCGYMQYFTK